MATVKKVEILLDVETNTMMAEVTLFKPSGKYYTSEYWRIPSTVPHESGHGERKTIGPYDMLHSPDFRRIDGGAVLVDTQEPWGYPHLFPVEYPCEGSVNSCHR